MLHSAHGVGSSVDMHNDSLTLNHLLGYQQSMRDPIHRRNVTHDEFEKIKSLLNAGVKPILSTMFPNPFVRAINTDNVRLINLLIMHNILPPKEELLGNIAKIYLEKKPFFDEFLSASQIDSIEKTMPALITSGVLDNEVKYLKGAIKKACDEIFDLLSQSKANADKSNKPLMILLGENHYSMHSLILEGIILYLSNNYFNINSAMSEVTFLFDSDPTKSLSERNSWGSSIGRWSIDIPITFFLDELNITPIRLDFGQLKRTFSDNISDEGVRIRNDEMVKRAIQYSDTDAVCIVGADHLSGFMEETELQQSFYVCAMNLCKTDTDHYASYYLSPEKCFQAIDLIKDCAYCVSPKMALNLVREICQKKIDERCGHTTLVNSSSSSKRSLNEITPAYSALRTSSEASAAKRQRVNRTDFNDERKGTCILL